MTKPQLVTPTPYPQGILHIGWVWSDAEKRLRGEPAIGPDGTIYVLGDDTLYAIDAQGHELWHYKFTECPISSPVLAGDGTVLYILVGGDQLQAIGSDGQARWTFQVENMDWAEFAVAPDGTAFLHSADTWYQILPDGSVEPFPWPAEGRGGRNPVFDAQGNLYTWVFPDEQVLILSPQGETLQECQKEKLGSGLTVGPDGTFYYRTGEAEVVARDAQCSVLWRYTLGEEKTYVSYPIIVSSDGTVYVGGSEGRVYALSSSGELLWQRTTHPGAAGLEHMLLPGDGTLLTMDKHGMLVALDIKGNGLWFYRFYEAGKPSLPYLNSTGELVIVQAGRLWFFTADDRAVYEEPSPVPLPGSLEQAELEVVSFTLKTVIRPQVDDLAEYIYITGEPWVGNPPEASLIIWAPPKDGNTMWPLDSSNPIKVWWQAGNQLIETVDKDTSITEYHERYIENRSAGVFSYAVYTLGITSMSDDWQTAEVYLTMNCGPTCGWGEMYTLRRSPGGEWWVAEYAFLWES